MNRKMKEEKAHASAKSKELHPYAYSQTNAAHLLQRSASNSYSRQLI
jgi:hypothetical protein